MSDGDDGCNASDGMMPDTFYPMNHVSWGFGSNPGTPVAYLDKETQFNGPLQDRSTSVADLNGSRSVDRSGDSGFGEHLPLTSASSGDVRPESSSCVTDDAGKMTSSGAVYSEVASTPPRRPSCEQDQLCLVEDEIVHLAEEPLTAGSGDEEEGSHGVVTSQDDVPRLDQVDGPMSTQVSDDNCAVDCLYYTLKCCDCRII